MIQKALDKEDIQNYVFPQFCSLSAFLKQIGFAKTQEMVAISALAFVCELETCCAGKKDAEHKRKQRA